MTEWTLRQVKPAELKNHPRSIDIYGTQPLDEELLQSIRDNGVIEPCRALPDGTLLSGHRRRQHAIAAKTASIPVYFAVSAIPEAKQIVEIVERNRHREKTVEQRAREFSRLADAKKVLAEMRQKRGKNIENDLGAFSPEGRFGAPGRAKDEAAEKVGMGRQRAERAKSVVERIDSLESSGRTAEAEELRSELNSGSVAKAARMADDAPPAAITDEFGTIPESLAPIFAQVPTFRGILQRIGAIKGDLEKLQKLPAGACLEIQDIIRSMDDARRAVKFAIPYCECPKCRRSRTKCDTCLDARWIPKATFQRCRTDDDEAWLKGGRE